MSVVIHNQVSIRGHHADFEPFLNEGNKLVMGGIVGECWDYSVRTHSCCEAVIEFFSGLSPLTPDLAALSKVHPKVLIQWQYFIAEAWAEAIVIASGGVIHAAGEWSEPHEDGPICGACDREDGGEEEAD